ncbi:MAG: ABC transporter permease [Gammaproteobacteria bacterium]|nr:ABC transporter permease [Gammaproteobacteria bacterium]
MLRIAVKMLAGDRGKYAGLLFGIAFTSFLITFAASFFCGFMTRGFSLISDNPSADVWVMDPAVESVDQTINIPASALDRVRSVTGVQSAAPLALAVAEARLPQGRFQSFQLIGVDDATLAGVPMARRNSPVSLALRAPDAVLIDSGGSVGKLETPRFERDQWPHGGSHLAAPTRLLATGDEFLVNDHRVIVAGYANALPRFPPRPLLYTTLSNAVRILPPERHRLTFVLASAMSGTDPAMLARAIETQTGLRARTAAEFKEDTVRWNLVNSEDVGDVGAMLTLAMTVGFGMTAVLLYIFTTESLKQYAVLKAMGATSGLLLAMVFVQAGVCALIGTGLGLGMCGIAGPIVAAQGFPFRMMWFTPLLGSIMVLVVCALAALISARPVLKLEPAAVFAGRS